MIDYVQLIEKYRDELNKIDFCKDVNMQICYSIEQLKTLVELGYIPNELYEWELRKIDEIKKRRNDWDEMMVNSSDIEPEDLVNQFFRVGEVLSPEQTASLYEDAVKGAKLLELLYENRDLLADDAINDLPNKFFESLQAGEFGISRLVSDPLNQVPHMLKNPSSLELVREDIYLLKWECKNSSGDGIRLEYRFRADGQTEADKQARAFVKRLTGKQKKVFEACWAIANQKMRKTYTCELTELMVIAYPARKDGSYFSIKEKVEFYQDLIDLSYTKIVVTKNHNSKKTKKVKDKNNDSFLLPLITIHKYCDVEGDKESEKYPNQISLSVLHNPLYESEKMYHVGASIKYATLELNADDMQLAEWIQVRKSQLLNEKFISLDRDFLIRLANLTETKHTGMANKRLLAKLARIKEKGIIVGHPRRISALIHLKIR